MLLALAAATAPVYLTCQWGSASAVELAIDEGNQRVTIARPNVEVTALPALFSPSEVKVSEKIGSETMTWLIDRVDLTLTTATSFSPTVRTSKCKLKPTPPSRAF